MTLMAVAVLPRAFTNFVRFVKHHNVPTFTIQVCECYNFRLSFLQDLQIRRHGLDRGHHFSQLCFSSVTQNIESPPVQRRDVVDEVGLRHNEFRLEVRSLGSESVNTKLGSERADANKLWRRDVARQEFTEAITHLIVGLGPGGKVRERSIRFELEEEDWHTSFADDVINNKVLRSFDTFVLGCYLVVLRRGEELEQEGVEGPIPVAIFCGEAINKKELF